MNKKALFILLLLICALGAGGFYLNSGGKNKETLPSEKVYHVGILSGLDFFLPSIDGFKTKMTELGYSEGKNIIYDVQKSNVDQAAYHNILQKFVSDKVDLILVYPTEASLEAKAVTRGTGIPFVFANAATDGVDLIQSIREPGENFTGVRLAGPDLAIKRLEIIHELAPKTKYVFAPYQRGYPIVPPQLNILGPAAKSLGMELIAFPADTRADIEKELAAHKTPNSKPIEAILMLVEPLVVNPDIYKLLVTFASENRIPMGGTFIPMPEYTNLFGVFSDSVSVGKDAAVLADKILSGIPAGTIPVVTAEAKIQLNYPLAKELGLQMAEGFLSTVDEIIR